MKRIDVKEMEKNVSFILKERGTGWGQLYPKEYSRVLVVKGHRVVLFGTTLFLNEKKFEEGVIYLSKDGARIVMTKCNEVAILDFSTSIIRRIHTRIQIRRGEAWNGHLGFLTEDGHLEVFKDGAFMYEKKDVKDFLLPDSTVDLDERFMDYENVKKLFRSSSGDKIIVVTEGKLILGDSEIENILHTGDVDYDRGVMPCYYHCDFHGVDLLASSNSSKFLFLGSGLHELDLEEEIKLLNLRTDEEFNVRYLVGMDHSGEYVYLIDEDGVLSKFEVCGIESEREAKGDVDFTEERYMISKEEGLKKMNEGNDSMNIGKDTEEKRAFASLNSLLDSAKGGNVSVESESKKPSGNKDVLSRKLTGDSRVDALIERVDSQIDEITKDFQGIKVEKKTFRMYKYNANDLSLSVEEIYTNVMRLENYRTMGDEMAEQLSLMLNSLEVYRGIDEENIRNAVRYIDSAIESISKGRRRRIVHYTKPLFYGIEKVGRTSHELSVKLGGVQKTLVDVDYTEKGIDNDDLGDGFTQHFNLSQGLADTIPGEKKEEPVIHQKEILSEKIEDKPDESYFGGNELLSKKENHTSIPTIQPSNIFGQPMPQGSSTQFEGLFSNTSPSNIFQSISNNPPTIPQAPSKKEEVPDQSTPNAFSRFASSRSLFK
ncbi:hypothetical protein EROM_060460 [Encephalitozoon romaleae SJ-2008]|uniref:Uncharacterized protein n=1 Tax=Encephalitozoon romaleae (strain SJ-2008) TaxID=1178016 RepID=I7AES3_ENCRO|nr:hypothetical protein EROM_060460 [Encephalitozoon romaleae SJ-2008]AFN83140.1 hypothetical protein EROM_060460 [Encephalitozoon romaleae SJ-2008]